MDGDGVVREVVGIQDDLVASWYRARECAYLILKVYHAIMVA